MKKKSFPMLFGLKIIFGKLLQDQNNYGTPTGAVELVDVSSELSELVRSPGLQTWKV